MGWRWTCLHGREPTDSLEAGCWAQPAPCGVGLQTWDVHWTEAVLLETACWLQLVAAWEEPLSQLWEWRLAAEESLLPLRHGLSSAAQD